MAYRIIYERCVGKPALVTMKGVLQKDKFTGLK